MCNASRSSSLRPRLTFANGMMAKKLREKIQTASHCSFSATKPNGIKTMRMLSHELVKSHQKDETRFGWPCSGWRVEERLG